MSFYGILADDLTGAMDAGMQMLDKGNIKVAIDHEELDAVTVDSDFVVVNTQTRNGCEYEAYTKTRQAADKLFQKGCDVFYKKIDSTLRGHIGSEIKAVLESERFDCCIVAPALPHNGRTTIDGIHYANGIKLSDTSFAKDPFAPIKYSAISDIISEEYEGRIGHINLNLIREGSYAVCDEIDKQVRSGCSIIIADSVIESDLYTIANGVKLYGGKTVLCGSAGLFKFFDIVWDMKRSEKNANRNPKIMTYDRRILAVSGSCANTSKKQVEYASVFRDDVKVIRFDTFSLVNEGLNGITRAAKNKECMDIRRSIAEKTMYSFEKGYNVALEIADSYMYEVLEHFGGNRHKLDCIRLLVSEAVAELTYYILANTRVANLVIFGGDTAYGVLKRLGVKGIEILSQIEPYIPYGALIGGEFKDMRVVTKAGDFGQEDTLCRIFDNL